MYSKILIKSQLKSMMMRQSSTKTSLPKEKRIK